MSTYQGFVDNPPIVFISYSWSSDDHVKAVIELAKRLRSDGIDVRIDKWDFKEGQDKYDFMEMMVKDELISKILIICDKKYSEKANDRKGGVGTETQIITPKVYGNAKQTKFIPILFERDSNGKEYLPTFLETRKYIDLTDEQNYEKNYVLLLRVIFDRPENEKPPVGFPPSHLFDTNTGSMTETYSKVKQFKNSVLEGKPSSLGLLSDYLDNLHSVMISDFQIKEVPDGVFFDELEIENINRFLPYRNEFIEVFRFIVNYQLDLSFYQKIYKFFNKLLNHYYSAPYSSSDFMDNYRFIGWELFLYSMAILISERKIEEFKIFVESHYFIESPNSSGLESYIVFRQYIRSLDETRKNRLKTNLISTAVTELEQRHHPEISFDLILQADLILFIRSKKKRYMHNWFPSTLIYTRGHNLEFFKRAEDNKEFNKLLEFLDLQSKDEFLKVLQEDRVLQNSSFFWVHLDIDSITNFSKLGTL